ncbi:hypothetical protein T552_03522 [Pneumocystis carinii B80]|uniref:Dilute domain-containing protein n=1 Tax=Pneumocystis carinii (strain B80) TaxID=1408658 RepID=A0A0W4ZBM1_PNEC8|nr:hypothetical protein T552_03522 [Pneumocystis carinii B80]KTW25662.1 hypothetical protein T552_03522 [Pneumocystis carinii B80]
MDELNPCSNDSQNDIEDPFTANDIDSTQSLDFHPAEDREWPWMDPWMGKNEGVLEASLRNYSGDDTTHSADASIIAEETLTDEEKKGILQSAFIRAASHGDVERIESMLKGGSRKYIDIDGCDETGGTAIIFAACFGHQGVVEALLEAGANINVRDKAKWSPLMWAINNHHGGIVKLLLAHGATFNSRGIGGNSVLEGTSQMDMIDILESLHVEESLEEGESFEDHEWYRQGCLEQMEKEKMMEMPILEDLEVDLSSIGFEGSNQEMEESEEVFSEEDFVWNRCLPEQMYIFSEDHISTILDLVITNFEPLRSADQKVIPADVIFLSIRFAHYYGTKDMLNKLLYDTLERIRLLIRDKPDDMAILAFWISNCMLLLYYIKKDSGLLVTIIDFQLHLTELIHDIYLVFLQETKFRIEKHLNSSILDYETISTFDNVTFENKWYNFRRQKKKNSFYLSPEKHATPSPLLITILFSSIFFILDVYQVHFIIFKQVVNQIFYWFSAELFNRIITKKGYLSRSKAMNIRLNISVIEDWARINNNQFQKKMHMKSLNSGYKSFNIYNSLKNHITPLVQLLQWLQCLTSLNSIENIETTVDALNLLTSTQLLYIAKNYKLEIDENKIGKEIIQYLSKKEEKDKNIKKKHIQDSENCSTDDTFDNPKPLPFDKEKLKSSNLLMNVELMLPFILPTGTDLLASYGSKIIKVDEKKKKCFIPVIPSDFMDLLKTKIGHNNEKEQIETNNEELNNEVQSTKDHDFSENIKI